MSRLIRIAQIEGLENRLYNIGLLTDLTGSSPDSTSRVWSPSVLNQWINSKGYVTTDTTYTAGTNISISAGNVISATDTKYTAGTLAILNAGTSTTNQLWSSKILNDWLTGKGYVTTDTTYTAGSGLTLTGTVFSLPIATSGSGNVVSDVTQTSGGLTITKSSISVGVTSVAMTVPTGLNVTGSPITSTGTLAVSFASGYSIPTTANQTSWTNKQNKLIAGTNITISGDTISAVNTNTTYTAGTGLGLAGTVFSIAPSYSPNVATNLLGANLNTITTAGFYYQPLLTNGTVANNYPIASTGSLNVYKDINVTQEYTSSGSDNKKYVRSYNGTAWTAWLLINANTTYSAGSGMTLTGTTFSVPVTTTGTGSFISSISATANGITATLGTPTNTTYSTGAIAELNTGTVTTGRLWGSNVLNAWLTGKGYVTTDTTYSAGTNISISAGNVISATDTKYTAGTNISISAGNVISATNSTYGAGTLAQLNTGTVTTNYLWSPKNISDFVIGKGYVTTDTTYTSSLGITKVGNDFRPNYGTTANTIAQGNDSRINNGQTAFGWASLGGVSRTSVSLNSSNDLDLVVTPGYYHHTGGSLPLNTPVGSTIAGYLEVVNDGGSFIRQTWRGRDYSYEYQRTRSSVGVWSDWVVYFNSGNFKPSDYVPYTGATSNVNLGTRSITSTGGFIGNATTATTLVTARTINGTSFNGSANITTALWGTARNITIGNTTKAVNGSANVSWSLAEIGATTETWSKDNFHKLAKTVVEATSAGYYTIATSLEANNVLGNVSAYLNTGTIGGVSVSNGHLVSFGVNASYGFQFYQEANPTSALIVRHRYNGNWTQERVAYRSWVAQQIGNLPSLTTTNKSNLVNAINEVNLKTTGIDDIGGRNLANLGGHSNNYLSTFFYASDYSLNGFTPTLIDGKQWIKKTTAHTPLRINAVPIIPNKVYTWSMDVFLDSSASSSVTIRIASYSSGSYNITNHVITNTPKRIYHTFLSKSTAVNDIPHLYDCIEGMHFANFQLQEGAVGTNWHLNPSEQISDWSETDSTKFSFIKNKPTIPTSSDFITTNTNQTGLSGRKTTSGQWVYSTTSATPITLQRYDNLGNSTISFLDQNNEGFNIGMATKDMFGIGSSADMANVVNRWMWVDSTGRIYSKNGFNKYGQNDTQILLAGGGHRPVSDFALAGSLGNYLPLAGGTMSGDISIVKDGQAGVNSRFLTLRDTDYATNQGRVDIAMLATNTDTGTSRGAVISMRRTNNLGTLHFEVSDNNLLSLIGHSQNVGVSTETPTEKLDVNGNIRVRALTSAGFVKTNASGVLSVDTNTYALASQLPTVNNGALTLSTGTGLSGSATFTANQSGSSTFSVAVASTHKLPTVAEWNALPTTNTITRLRGTTSGTYTSGDLTLLAGANTTITQSGANITIASTNTNTTYTAGTGLSLTGTTFGQAITTSGTGTYVQSITQTASGFQINLGTPPNTNTTYASGTNALLSAGTDTAMRVWSASTLGQLSYRATSGQTNSVIINDTRNVDDIPSTTYRKGVFFDFKTSTAIGLTGMSSYSSVVTMIPYSDASGWVYSSWRMAQSRGKLQFQHFGSTAWQPWNEIYHTGNLTAGTNITITNGTISAVNTNTTYSAGTGLSLSGTTFGQAITTSGTGTFVTGITQTTNGFQINLGTPPNTNTTYALITQAAITAGTETTGRLISAKLLTDNYTPLSRSISTGTGLTGGGNLTTNRTFSIGAGVTPLTSTLLSTSDLNTIVTPGYYHQTSNAYATTARNYPNAMAGSLQVLTSAGIQQIYRNYNTNITWRRDNYGGTWSTWVRVNPNTTYSLASNAELASTTSTTARLISGQRLNAWATTKGFLTSVPTMTATVEGTAKLFSATVQSVASTAVSATASRTYGIQKNSAGQLVVNVPWSNTNTTYSVATLAELQSTTSTTGRLISGQRLNQWASAMGWSNGIFEFSPLQGIQTIGWLSSAPAQYAMALGRFTTASAGSSVSIGNTVNTTGVGSVSVGFSLSNKAPMSIVLGSNSSNEGENSTVLGRGLVNNARNSTVVGNYNVINVDSSSTEYDQYPVFTIGNGTSADTRSNALEVYQNGMAYAHNLWRYSSSNISVSTTDNNIIPDIKWVKAYVSANGGGGGAGTSTKLISGTTYTVTNADNGFILVATTQNMTVTFPNTLQDKIVVKLDNASNGIIRVTAPNTTGDIGSNTTSQDIPRNGDVVYYRAGTQRRIKGDILFY